MERAGVRLGPPLLPQRIEPVDLVFTFEGGHPRKALRGGIQKSNFIVFSGYPGSSRPKVDKTAPMAPRTHLRYPHEWPSVDTRMAHEHHKQSGTNVLSLVTDESHGWKETEHKNSDRRITKIVTDEAHGESGTNYKDSRRLRTRTEADKAHGKQRTNLAGGLLMVEDVGRELVDPLQLDLDHRLRFGQVEQFRVSVFRFRVSGFGFKVSGSRFRVWG